MTLLRPHTMNLAMKQNGVSRVVRAHFLIQPLPSTEYITSEQSSELERLGQAMLVTLNLEWVTCHGASLWDFVSSSPLLRFPVHPERGRL